jgi:bifunctional DNase/RNase
MRDFPRADFRSRWSGATLALALTLAAAGCRSSTDVEVRVHSVGVDPATRAPVVLLEDRSRQVALPIWVGSAEAHAIAMEAEGMKSPRPMTHDLLRDALAGAGVAVEKVVIESLHGDTYHARVHLRSLRRNFDLDARPSDAIALAMRSGSPIYASESLMRGATVVSTRGENLIRRLTTVAGLTVQNLDADLADAFGVDPGRGGVVVTNVAPPLRGLMRRGDVVLGVDGTALQSADELVELLGRARTGGALLDVRRRGRDLRIELPPRG